MDEVPQPEPEFKTPQRKNPLEKVLNLVRKFQKFLAAMISQLLAKHQPKQDPETSILIEQPEPEGILGLIESKLPKPLRPYFARYGLLLISGLVILVLVFGIKSCFFKKSKSKLSLSEVVSQEKKKEEGPLPVKGFKVARFNFEDSLNALGTIKGSVEFKLSFEVPGTLSSINYREGERYEEGALLISLRQDDILLRLKRAQAEMNKYQTQASITEQKVKEHEKLVSMGAIPKSTLENVKLELESAQYETEASRLEVKAAESMLEKSNLYAPSAGMIGELNIEEGESVTANTLLGTHISTEFVYAEFGIVERDVNKIALGQKARVFVDAFPDKTFEGVIENISPVVAGTSRTATAKVRIENPERLLLPGMFARIRILLYSKKNTLVVPTDSVQGGQGEQFIFVITLNQKPSEESASPEVAGEPVSPKAKGKKDKKSSGKEPAAESENEEKDLGIIEKRAITIGYTRPDYSQIDAGISEGEVVAVTGLEKLEDGKKVRLLETQEAEV